ncbi:MAG: hypothetical protein KC613_04500 [Myxococcales bacterium]|nr:hypothetical protein [Myxococcales bacterium]MCB9523812.1 hypothetical protein [Myxococcales bacterium]
MVTRVLLLGDALALRPAQRVAACFGAEIERRDPDLHLFDKAKAFAPHVVILHLEGLGEYRRMVMERMATLPGAPPVIVLAETSPPPCMAELLERPWFDHLMGLQAPWFMEELAVTLATLTGRPLFGLEKYLPWGSRIVEIPIGGSADKDPAFDRITAFMEAIGIRGRLVDRLCALADELLMNAIYDAPVDRRSGEARYHGLPRSTPVALDPDERPVLRFGSDGQRFGLSVRDPFGALSPTTFKGYIAKGLRGGEDQIDAKVGGAGLGLYLLFSSLGTMVLNVHRRQQTEVIGLVDIRGSFRDLQRAPRSLHVFERR